MYFENMRIMTGTVKSAKKNGCLTESLRKMCPNIEFVLYCISCIRTTNG